MLKAALSIVAGAIYVVVFIFYQAVRGVGRCIFQTDLNDIVDPTLKKVMTPWKWVWLNGK